MRMKRLVPILAVLLLVISACAPAVTSTPGIPETGDDNTPVADSTPVATLFPGGGDDNVTPVPDLPGPMSTSTPLVEVPTIEGTLSPVVTGEVGDQEETPDATADPGANTDDTVDSQDLAGQQALDYLSGQLGLPRDSFQVVQVSSQTWPDSCLGLGDMDESCAAVQTPGYRVVIEREDGQRYVVRTNAMLTEVRVVFGNPGAPEGVVIPDAGEVNAPEDQDQEARTISAEAAADVARHYLSRIMGLPIDQIRIVEAEAAQWDDVCLGTGVSGETCFQAPTSGYRITLEANGQQYEVRTDMDATVRRLVNPESNTP